MGKLFIPKTNADAVDRGNPVRRTIVFLNLLICATILVSCITPPRITSTVSVTDASLSFAYKEDTSPPGYYSARKVDLSLGIEGGYSLPISITKHNGILVVLYRFIPEDGESRAKHYLVTYDADGKRLELMDLSGEWIEIISGIRSGADGNLLIYESCVAETTVHRYSISEQTVTGVITLSLPEGYVNTENLYTDSKGQYYLTADGTGGPKVFIFDANGKRINSEYREGLIGTAFQVDDFFYFEAFVESSKRILYPIDIQNAEFLAGIDASEMFGNEIVFSGFDYLCSMNSEGFYRFDSTTREKQTMILWSESGIDSRLLVNGRPEPALISVDTLYLMVENEDEYFEKELYLLQRQKNNPNAGKKTLILATIGSDMDYVLQKAIRDFNNNETDYKIKYIDYYPWSRIDYSLSWEEINKGFREAERQLYIDILSGNGPDIIVGPDRAMKESGLLIDLMPMIQSDIDFHAEDFLANVIESAKDGDILYSFPVFFSLDGLAGKSSAIGDRTGWNINEFNKMAQSLPKGMVPFADFSQSELLTEALTVPASGYYDSGKSGDRIIKEEFVTLLKWAKEFGIPDEIAKEGRESGAIYENHNNLIRDGKLAIVGVQVSSPGAMKTAYGYYEKMTYTGFPSPNRIGLSISASEYAVTTSCEAPEIAWMFIKSLLSEEMQKQVIREEQGIPVRLSSLDLLIDFSVHMDQYPELIRETDWDWNTEDPELKEYIKFLREVGIPKFEEIVHHVDSIRDPDYDFIEIVLEEAAAYFNDMKTAEEVVDIINNRARALFNERAR